MVCFENNKYKIDWLELSKTIKQAIRFLDNIITVNHYSLPEVEAITKANRKIGLGVMGWAEMLIKLEIPYASIKAVKLAEKLMKFIKENSYKTSVALAKEKGSFPEWKNSMHKNKEPLRNATCNSIAPTGTISVIADTSYSIEPLFALFYKRTGILGGKEQIEINKLFISKLKSLGLWNKKIKQRLINTDGINGISGIPVAVKKYFETSLEIPWKYHLLHQKAFQKYTDNAVSKTINLAETVTVKDVSEIYRTAWEYKLKGITIYRYGSKTNQVLRKCSFISSTGCEI